MNPNISKPIFFGEPLLRPITVRAVTLAPGAERPAVQAVDEDDISHRCLIWIRLMECGEPERPFGLLDILVSSAA
jgi:hypothetical protein